MDYKIIVKEGESGRIDSYIAGQVEISRSKIQTLIREGKVYLNGHCAIAKDKVEPEDIITFEYIEDTSLDVKATKMELDIVYEDDDIMVIDKPKGLVTHPAAGNFDSTLVNGLKAYTDSLSSIGGEFRPGIVHRLDKDTSGLLVVAKNDQAHVFLADQLQDKTCYRKYYAIVKGVIEHDEGEIDAPIGRDRKDRQKMAVVSDGKPAKTEFTVLNRFGDSTLLDVELKTGRTHQIRVHMKYIGHPVLNDPKYDPNHVFDDKGQYLHAYFLSFIHPRTRSRVTFESPMPSYMREYIERRTK